MQQEIGSGGMGKVYQAKDLKLNRNVAIKRLLSAGHSTADKRRRFIIEAQSASALNHPNIITIFDIIEENGADYMVMELLPGKTLQELIPRNGLRAPMVIGYGVQISDGLAAAHIAGIIHRDLKPGNIMISDRGIAKILDFGLAKLTETTSLEDPDATCEAGLTMEGMIMGTLSYMSPEQAQAKKVDARSDIFSFGAVLYEMACGVRAFAGNSSAVILTSVLRDEPRSLLELTPDIPPELERAIWKCLRKDPDERWQTMDELHKALLALYTLSESGVLYRVRGTAPASVSIPAPTPPPAVISKTPVAIGLALMVVLIAAGILWWNLQPGSKPNSETVNLPETQPTPQLPAAKDHLTNADIADMVKATVPESLILSQMKNSKTEFDLSSDGVIELVKRGVSEKLIEAMRNPKKISAAATIPVKPEEKPTEAPKTILVAGGTPISLSLDQDIPSDTEQGADLLFVVSEDVKVNGQVVVARGAIAKGKVAERARRKLIGSQKMTYRLLEVNVSAGSSLKLRPVEKTFENAGKRKNLAAEKGGIFVGYVDGDQSLAIGR